MHKKKGRRDERITDLEPVRMQLLCSNKTENEERRNCRKKWQNVINVSYFFKRENKRNRGNYNVAR